jgi:Flp pilus assembly protein TadG
VTRRRADEGSVAVELTVLTPVVLALLCLVVGLGRIADADGQVTGAARDAARAASLARTPADAIRLARQAAATDVAQAGIDCRDLQVATDTTTFIPGGTVRVTVRCTVDLSGLAFAGLPGAKTLVGASAAPLELYRGGAG